jgi:hypothetical protein
MMNKFLQKIHCKKYDFMVAGILILPFLFVFRKLFTGGHLFLFPGCDGPFYFYPMTVTGMEQWHHGIIPLWTNLIHCGFPLIADGQGALLYPFNLIAFMIFPNDFANNIVIVFQTVLSTILMYIYLKNTGISRWTAIIPSWIWTAAGPVAASIGSPALNGIIWWPLWFLLADLIIRKNDMRIVAFTGFSMGLGWLGGFPQTTFYGILCASFYFMFRTFTIYSCQLSNCLKPVINWAIAGIIGLGIAAVQMIPTAEMARFSIRTGDTAHTFTAMGSMLPVGIIHLILPTWGSLSEFQLAGSNLYFGLVCLAAATLTIKKSKNDPVVVFFWILAFAGIFFAAGKFNPFYKIITMIPGFNFFRYPYRFTYWTVFSLSVLTGIGFEYLFIKIKNGKPVFRRMFITIAVLTSITVGFTVSGTLVFNAKKESIQNKLTGYVGGNVINAKFKQQHAEYYESKIERMITAISTAINPLHKDIISSVIFAICALIILLAGRYMPHHKTLLYAMLLVVAGINLWMFFGKVGTVRASDLKQPELAGICNHAGSMTRIYTVNTQDDFINGFYSYNRLDPDFNMLFNVEHVGVYSALGSMRYNELMSRLGGVNLAFGMPPVTENDVTSNMPILNLLNAGYIVSNEPLNVPGIDTIRNGNPFVYKNNHVLPRSFVVPNALIIKDKSDILNTMQSPSYDPGTSVILETAPDFCPQNGIKTSATIEKYESQKISIDANGPGWLVLTEMFYPGWRAKIDGNESRIYNGDYIFRTIPLSQGRHHIVFYYTKAIFVKGMILTVLSLLLLSAMFFSGFIRQKKACC